MNKEKLFDTYAMLYEKSMERTPMEELLAKFSTKVLSGEKDKMTVWISHKCYKIRESVLSLFIEQRAHPGNLSQEQFEQLLETLANMRIVENMLAEMFYINGSQVNAISDAMSKFYLDSPMFSEKTDNEDSES